ncbi:MAG: M20/M25/M40 family metallo-hydrolase [Verrucomicrobia bacterium]|nr:M20/M25/M40 family metallo-hydrolase [Verrucomicrobiota bacterium]
MDSNLLKQSAEKYLPEALDWLRRMVEINSFTTNVEGVASLAVLTVDCFKDLGFTATLAASTHPQHGDHLFLSRGPADQQPIVLVTHLDTVFPAEEELRNNFRWLVEGYRIYGPGTVDNKGGTIMIWLMMQVLREVNPAIFEKTHWVIAANSAEEVIGSDFAECTHDRCPDGARAVLVFEGGPLDETGWHVVTSRKGRAEYRITCTGRAAHAGSNHALGINSVVELSKLLPRVAALTDPARDLTVNVANIHGGTVLNRVPHEAAAELEMRAFDPAVLLSAGQALEALAGQTEAGAEIKIECVGRTRAWPGGPETDLLFQHWQKHAALLGMRAVPMRRGGLSDANYLCGLGPTLDALGPVGGNAHCSEHSADGSKLPEYVEPASFVPKAVLNLLAISEL